MSMASPGAGAGAMSSPTTGANAALVKQFGQGASPHAAPPTDTKTLNKPAAPEQDSDKDKAGEKQDSDKDKQDKDKDEDKDKKVQQQPAQRRGLRPLRFSTEGIPDPGSIVFPLTFLILLQLFLVPYGTAKKTRAQLLWDVLIGQADFNT